MQTSSPTWVRVGLQLRIFRNSFSLCLIHWEPSEAEISHSPSVFFPLVHLLTVTFDGFSLVWLPQFQNLTLYRQQPLSSILCGGSQVKPKMFVSKELVNSLVAQLHQCQADRLVVFALFLFPTPTADPYFLDNSAPLLLLVILGLCVCVGL